MFIVYTFLHFSTNVLLCFIKEKVSDGLDLLFSLIA